jgi:cell division protein FtsB
MSDNLWDAAGYLDDKIAKLRAENADLKAEVNRLRAASFVTAVPSEDYEKLKSQVEALRKSVSALTEAGDDLWFSIRHYARQDKSERLDAIEDWLYAKDKANRNR